MNIYAGFSTIPIIGPALGIAGAAAAIAFGGEQAGKILTARDGGIMTGGIPGIDSIPTLTAPGELVAPEKNFDEVVNAVATSRLQEEDPANAAAPRAEIQLTLTDNLVEFVEAQIVERQNLGVSLLDSGGV